MGYAWAGDEGISVRRDPLGLGALYVGSIVGAGFATGQEILVFFGRFGGNALWGVLLAAACFMLFGARMFAVLGAGDARPSSIFQRLAGRRAGLVLDVIVALFIFTGLAVVMAAGGALGAEQFGWNYGSGVATVMGVSALAIALGVRGALLVNAVLVLVLISGFTGFFIEQVLQDGVVWSGVPEYGEFGRIAPTGWVFAAVLYVGYNFLIVLPALSPFSGQLAGVRGAAWYGALGGLVLGFLLFIITLSLQTHFPEALYLNVPMAYIAALHGPFWQFVYALSLASALITTALASALALGARMGRSPISCRVWSIVALGLAHPLTSLGFAGLVRTAYPLAGYAGIIVLVLLLRPSR